MATPTTILTCPDCGATLRPHKPPNPGNKVRCPGCKVIFTVGGEPEPSGALLEPPEPVLESAPLNPLAGLADALAADPVQPVPPSVVMECGFVAHVGHWSFSRSYPGQPAQLLTVSCSPEMLAVAVFGAVVPDTVTLVNCGPATTSIEPSTSSLFVQPSPAGSQGSETTVNAPA